MKSEMKRKTGIIMGLITAISILFTMLFVNTIYIYAAASITVSPSKSTLTPGEKFTVTLVFKDASNRDLGGLDGEVTYDSNIIEYVEMSSGAGNEATKGKILISAFSLNAGVKSFEFKITFIAKKDGSTSIKAASTVFSVFDTSLVENSNKSATVTVKTKSSNANLKSLTVTNGTLSPAFSAAQSSYKVNIKQNVNTKITGTAADAAASVSGNNTYSINAGETKNISIKVTAENGTTKTYTIAVTREKVPVTSVPKTPTPTPKTPTPTPTTSAQKTPTSTGNTATPSQNVTNTPIVSETVGATGETGVPNETGTMPSEETTQTAFTTTEPIGSPAITMESSNQGKGIFSVQAAFIFCAVGMFTVGASVGYMTCFLIKKKKIINNISKGNHYFSGGDNENI